MILWHAINFADTSLELWITLSILLITDKHLWLLPFCNKKLPWLRMKLINIWESKYYVLYYAWKYHNNYVMFASVWMVLILKHCPFKLNENIYECRWDQLPTKELYFLMLSLTCKDLAGITILLLVYIKTSWLDLYVSC